MTSERSSSKNSDHTSNNFPEDITEYIDLNSPILKYLIEIEKKFWASKTNKNYRFPLFTKSSGSIGELAHPMLLSNIDHNSYPEKKDILTWSKGEQHERDFLQSNGYDGDESLISLEGVTYYDLEWQNLNRPQGDRPMRKRGRKQQKRSISPNYRPFSNLSKFPESSANKRTKNDKDTNRGWLSDRNRVLSPKGLRKFRIKSPKRKFEKNSLNTQFSKNLKSFGSADKKKPQRSNFLKKYRMKWRKAKRSGKKDFSLNLNPSNQDNFSINLTANSFLKSISNLFF